MIVLIPRNLWQAKLRRPERDRSTAPYGHINGRL